MSIAAWIIIGLIPGFFGGAVVALHRKAVRVKVADSEQSRIGKT